VKKGTTARHAFGIHSPIRPKPRIESSHDPNHEHKREPAPTGKAAERVRKKANFYQGIFAGAFEEESILPGKQEKRAKIETA